jgi:hypothetical protein
MSMLHVASILRVFEMETKNWMQNETETWKQNEAV